MALQDLVLLSPRLETAISRMSKLQESDLSKLRIARCVRIISERIPPLLTGG